MVGTLGGEERVVGMYSTKAKVNNKADAGLLSINTGSNPNMVDVYGKKSKPALSDSRYYGKQFAVGPGKKTASRHGECFSTVYPLPTGYQEKISYRKVERKKGFGSGDAPKRDEFSSNIAIEQYREAIKAEKKTAKAAAMKMLEEKVAVVEEIVEEIFMFDQVHRVDVDLGVGVASKTMKAINLGTARTTTSAYGIGCANPKNDGKNGRFSVTETFYNSGHLTVGETD